MPIPASTTLTLTATQRTLLEEMIADKLAQLDTWERARLTSEAERETARLKRSLTLEILALIQNAT